MSSQKLDTTNKDELLPKDTLDTLDSVFSLNDLTEQFENDLGTAMTRLEVNRSEESLTLLRRYNAIMAGVLSDIDQLPDFQKKAARAAVKVYVDSGRRIVQKMRESSACFIESRRHQIDSQMRFSESTQKILALAAGIQPPSLFSFFKPSVRRNFMNSTKELSKARESASESINNIRADVDRQADSMDQYVRMRVELERNVLEMVDIVNGYRGLDYNVVESQYGVRQEAAIEKNNKLYVGNAVEAPDAKANPTVMDAPAAKPAQRTAARKKTS